MRCAVAFMEDFSLNSSRQSFARTLLRPWKITNCLRDTPIDSIPTDSTTICPRCWTARAEIGRISRQRQNLVSIEKVGSDSEGRRSLDFLVRIDGGELS